MKIAQIAPLYESVPPRFYGGTERVVHFLTEELVRLGHDVTLFASGDSVTRAQLVPYRHQALRLDPQVTDALPHHLAMLAEVRRRADQFDLLHFHTDLIHLPLFADCADRMVTTLHGRLDLPDLAPFYRTYGALPLVSISAAQRRPMPPVRWVGTVPHGLPADLLPFSARPGRYLAFLGRMSPEKGPDRAIDIAERCGLPLRMAAKVDRADRDFFEQVVRPRLKPPHITFVGEIDERRKAAFLGHALALLFPIDWPEPFGLVMIEAMATGTPVIAFPAGSVPEIITDGRSGFIVDSVDAAVGAVGRLKQLDRQQVRRHFDHSFTAERMALDYLAIYHALQPAAERTTGPRLPVPVPAGELT